MNKTLAGGGKVAAETQNGCSAGGPIPVDEAGTLAGPLPQAESPAFDLAGRWRRWLAAFSPAVPDDLAPLILIEQANDFAAFALALSIPGLFSGLALLVDFWHDRGDLLRVVLTCALGITYPLLFARSGTWRGVAQKSTNAARTYLTQSTVTLCMNGIGWGMLLCLYNAHPTVVQRDTLYGVMVGCVSVTLLITPLSCALAYLVPVAAGCLAALMVQDQIDHFTPAMLISYTGFIMFAVVSLNKRLLARTLGSLRTQEQAEVIKMLLRDFEESASDWLWETDPDLHLHNTSKRLAEITRRGSEPFTGTFPFCLRSAAVTFDNRPGSPAAELNHILDAREPFSNLVIPITIGSAQHVWSFTGKPNYDRAGRFTGYHGVGSDITAERRQQAEIAHLARHDTLTGLPNRMSFAESLSTSCADCDASPFALVYVDLDFFKTVNDTLGHAAGDLVLQQAAARMRQSLPPGAIAARLGGDEFAILLPGSDPAVITTVIEQTAASVSAPYMFEGQEARIGASIGIAMAPLHGTSPEALLSHADLAMYHAKNSGKGRHSFYDADTDRRQHERRAGVL